MSIEVRRHSYFPDELEFLNECDGFINFSAIPEKMLVHVGIGKIVIVASLTKSTIYEADKDGDITINLNEFGDVDGHLTISELIIPKEN